MDEKLNIILHKVDMSFYILLVALSINIATTGFVLMVQNDNLLSNVKQIHKAMNIYNVEKE